MKNHILKSLGLAAMALAFNTELRAGDDSTACSTRSLRGAFGYTVTGTTPANQPFAAVGRIVFDGQGNVTTVRTLSSGGTVVRNDTGAGSYAVASDCRGSFTIGAAGLGQLQVDILVTSDGKELRGIVTNTGFVLTLQGTKISTRD